MLASMSGTDPRAEMPLVNCSDLGVSGLLPTGTVTLVLADVESSTRLWENQPDEMTAAIARLNQTVSEESGQRYAAANARMDLCRCGPRTGTARVELLTRPRLDI
jgi:class 3 adenylate cyclase